MSYFEKFLKEEEKPKEIIYKPIVKPKTKRKMEIETEIMDITKYVEPFLTKPQSRKISSDKVRNMLGELTGVSRRPTRVQSALAIIKIMEILIPIFEEEDKKRRKS